MSERASRAAAAKRAKERGGELYAQKRWDDAIGAFGEAIAVAPKDDEDVAVYHSNRAAAYLQRGDAASAKRAFSKEHRGARSPDAMSRTFSQSRGSSSKELRAISILPNDAVLVATSK